eukprot:3128851-Rhodomonas_salina.1
MAPFAGASAAQNQTFVPMPQPQAASESQLDVGVAYVGWDPNVRIHFAESKTDAGFTLRASQELSHLSTVLLYFIPHLCRPLSSLTFLCSLLPPPRTPLILAPRAVQVLVLRLAQGDYFGEIALVSNKPRQATVKAFGNAT